MKIEGYVTKASVFSFHISARRGRSGHFLSFNSNVSSMQSREQVELENWVSSIFVAADSHEHIMLEAQNEEASSFGALTGSEVVPVLHAPIHWIPPGAIRNARWEFLHLI